MTRTGGDKNYSKSTWQAFQHSGTYSILMLQKKKVSRKLIPVIQDGRRHNFTAFRFLENCIHLEFPPPSQSLTCRHIPDLIMD